MSEKKELNGEQLEKVTGGSQWYEYRNQVQWTRNVNDNITINDVVVGQVKQLGVVSGAMGLYYPVIRVEFTDGVHEDGWYDDDEKEFTAKWNVGWISEML